MRYDFRLSLCLIASAFALFWSLNCFAQTQTLTRWEVGQPIVHQNLVVFPVRIVSGTGKSDLLTLSEAQQKNLVSVRELPEARVSEVLVENKSEKPLLLMGGEIILGGKQDRIVEQDVIVPPKKAAAVKVYCVEPGRWTPQELGERFAPAKKIVAPEVRKSAQVAKSQQHVWAYNERVQRQLPASIPMGSSQSYRRVLTDTKVQKETEAYIRAIQSKLARDQKACGMIVAVNGVIEWLDVFSDPSLFRKVMPSLLHSAAVQALAKRSQSKISRIPSVSEAKAFLEQAQRSQRKVEAETGHLKRERFETSTVTGFETKFKVSGKQQTTPLHMNAYRR